MPAIVQAWCRPPPFQSAHASVCPTYTRRDNTLADGRILIKRVLDITQYTLGTVVE